MNSIKLSGLVTSEYCAKASLAQSPSSAGTVWTNPDSSVTSVISKNHHRLSDQRSLITVFASPNIPTPDVETTAQQMFEIISKGDRYETIYEVAYKQYEFFSPDSWQAVVYGGTVQNGGSAPKVIDPYVMLNEKQFFLSARVFDTVKDSGTAKVTEKRYIKKSENLYQAMVITPNKIYASNTDFNTDDMFRALAAGDTYHADQKVWTVQEKHVFFIATIGGFDFFAREILFS